MKIGKLAGVLAGVTVTGLALAGCSAGNEIQSGTTVSVAQNQGFTSVNTAAQFGSENTTYNTNIDSMTSGGFFWYDDQPKLVLNPQFGTITQGAVNADGSFTVTWKIADGVKWSDGTPVDAVDLLLNWISSYGIYNDDATNNPNVSTHTGVDFTSISVGAYDNVVDTSALPVVSDDHKSITVTFTKPYIDWQIAMSGAGIPAHIVAEETDPTITDATAAKKYVLDAIQNKDYATLAKLANTWATKWNFTDTPSDPKLLVSDGPYVLKSVTKDQSATVQADPNYNSGPKPKVDTITFKVIPDPTAQVQALQNGDVSVIYGQATQDTVTQLKSVTNATTETDAAATYEHIDLTLNNGGPFDPKTYGGDANKALLVRQAFLETIPRQDIVDKLIKPINANAVLDESQVFLPGAPGYDDSVKQNGSSAYDTVNIDDAKAKLAQAGVTGTVDVKFMYGKSNTRRAAEYQLIAASAKQAGFNVIDDGDDNWGEKLGDGTYDAALFAWAYSTLSPLGNEATFKTSQGNNFTGYSNSDVDSAFTKLEGTYDQTQQIALQQQIDKDVWADAYGVTIFQFPDVSAWANTLTGVSYSPLVPNIYWDPWNWVSTAKSAAAAS